MTGAYLHINKENPDQGMLENILLQQHFLRHTSQDTHLSVGVHMKEIMWYVKRFKVTMSTFQLFCYL